MRGAALGLELLGDAGSRRSWVRRLDGSSGGRRSTPGRESNGIACLYFLADPGDAETRAAGRGARLPLRRRPHDARQSRWQPRRPASSRRGHPRGAPGDDEALRGDRAAMPIRTPVLLRRALPAGALRRALRDLDGEGAIRPGDAGAGRGPRGAAGRLCHPRPRRRSRRSDCSPSSDEARLAGARPRDLSPPPVGRRGDGAAGPRGHPGAERGGAARCTSAAGSRPSRPASGTTSGSA